MTLDQAIDFARDLDVPEDRIDEVLAGAELCNCGNEGVCQENSESHIRAAAERLEASI